MVKFALKTFSIIEQRFVPLKEFLFHCHVMCNHYRMSKKVTQLSVQMHYKVSKRTQLECSSASHTIEKIVRMFVQSLWLSSSFLVANLLKSIYFHGHPTTLFQLWKIIHSLNNNKITNPVSFNYFSTSTWTCPSYACPINTIIN
jgi:hypothetical protein